MVSRFLAWISMWIILLNTELGNMRGFFLFVFCIFLVGRDAYDEEW